MQSYNSKSRLTEQTALMLSAACLLSGLAAYFLSYTISSQGILPLAIFSALALFVSLVAWMHGRLERLAAEETENNEKIKSGKGDIFSEDKIAFGDKNRTLVQYEKYIVPAAVMILVAAEAASVLFLQGRLPDSVRSPLESPSFHIGILFAAGVFAFILFILGKYSAGLAYTGGRRQLRAPSALTVFAALFTLLAIGAFVAAFLAIRSESWKFRNPDPFLLYSGMIVLSAFCLDHFFGLVLFFYRPREKSRNLPPVYESRIAGLFVQPEGVWEAVNEMLEYQFGIRVSPERFASFFFRTIIPLVIFQIVCLLLLSSIAVVPSQKRGFVERLGEPVRGEQSPGLHFKLPWPLEKIYYVDADQVFFLDSGSLRQDVSKSPAAPENYLWSSLPEDAPLYLTVNPRKTETENQDEPKTTVVNLVGVEVAVQYFIDKSSDYMYKNVDADKIFRQLLAHSLTSYMSSCDGITLVGGNTLDMENEIAAKLNRDSEKVGLGVKVVDVALTRIQPPTKGETVRAFQMTMIAEQNRRTAVYDAESYSNKVIPESNTRAKILLTEAETYKISRTSSAQAESEVFNSKYELLKKYGEIYSTTSYLDKLVKGLQRPSKIVVTVDADDQVLSFDLKNVVTPELLDMVSPENMEK